MDTIGDFLTRVRNAGMAQHDKVDVPSSKMREGIAGILKEQGYIRDYRTVKDGKQGMMRIYLKYRLSGEPAITKMYRVSTPGRRRYIRSTEISPVRSGYGLSVLSTSKGLMTGEDAKAKNVGGEVLFNIW